MLDKLNRQEILRYLGYRDGVITEQMENLLNQCEAEVLEIVEPRYIYRSYPLQHTDGGIRVLGTPMILKGEDIRRHLEGCVEVYLLAATAGMELDRRIRRYMITKPDVGVVMNSYGIQAVEQIADFAEDRIRQLAGEKGFDLTWRFSPGYGDFPIETQKDFMQVLDMQKKIGVSLTESCLMIPGKSVTAVLGCRLSDERIGELSLNADDNRQGNEKNRCEFCNGKDNCQYRKRGTTC